MTSVPLTDTQAVFTPDYQNPKIRAAGCLLYAFNQKDGRTYVLLSQHNASGKPCDIDKWEGIGGFQEKGATLTQTIFEELFEESRRLISLSYETVDHGRLIVFEQQNCYLQMAIPVDYDETLPAKFQQTVVPRPDGCKNMYGSETFYNPDTNEDELYNPFMEKNEVRWICLDDLVQSIQENSPYVKDRERNEDIPLRGVFLKTMTRLAKAAPDVFALMKDPSTRLPSPRFISDKDIDISGR